MSITTDVALTAFASGKIGLKYTFKGKYRSGPIDEIVASSKLLEDTLQAHAKDILQVRTHTWIIQEDVYFIKLEDYDFLSVIAPS